MGRMMKRKVISAFLVGVAILGSTVNCCSAELKILTTGILKGAFPEIAQRFEQETGNKLTMSWGPSSGNSPEASQVRIRNGERVDVLLMVSPGMEELIKGGYFTPLERKNVAVSVIGVAVKDGHPRPDIGTVPALRQALLNAKSVGYSEGASGTYISTVLLDKLGIAEQIKPKSKVILGRKFVGEALVDNEVELGLQQLSELRLEPGIVVIGPLPDEVQKKSIVSAAVSSTSTNAQAAKQFYDFLSTPFAREAMTRSGLQLP
jgi:molybdate transport system substrate-binding protein